MKQDLDQRYRVRYTMKDGSTYDFTVFAKNRKAAMSKARYTAGLAGVPVLECEEKLL